MSIQELLTYVEELSFKTSMIGYDKDEVDIQLDKICDEMEAIVKEKDDEIAALRSGAPTAPVVVDLNSEKDDKEAAEGKEAPFKMETPEEPVEKAAEEVNSETAKEQAPAYNDASIQIEDLKDQIRELKQQLQAAEKQAVEAEKRADEAEQRAVEAENQAEAAEVKLSTVEAELRAAREEAEAGKAEPGEKAPAEEKAETQMRTPENTDEAYQLYMKNADLLCRQLAVMDTQKDAIVTEANQEAEKILGDAREEEARILEEAHSEAGRSLEAAKTEAETLLNNARAEVERLTEESDNQRKAAEEEALKIVEDGRLQMQQDREDYQKLLEKKSTLVEFMRDISADISSLLNKVQDTAPEEE